MGPEDLGYVLFADVVRVFPRRAVFQNELGIPRLNGGSPAKPLCSTRCYGVSVGYGVALKRKLRFRLATSLRSRHSCLCGTEIGGIRCLHFGQQVGT